ncbi:hypothetical protein [Streptomyces kronopolitis]|uniref:hypothetical protein n=1 Tax=Streptomyces kronopolitis TaxID=1612435 RepID=UPI003693927F
MATHIRAELAIEAMTMAVATRGGNATGVIFHADRARKVDSTGRRDNWLYRAVVVLAQLPCKGNSE